MGIKVNKSNEDMVMRREIIVTDWDGVLQMIDKAWCYMIKTQREKLEPWLDFSKLESYDTNPKQFLVDLFNRDEYYLNKWLRKEELKDKELPRGVFEFIMGLYSYHDGFYEGCDWLSMMDAIAGMAQQSFVQEIIILTHVPYSNGRDLRKEKLFEEKIKPIAPNKFKLVQLHTSESKAEWIKNNCPDFTVFIDDRADIIQEVVKLNSVYEKIFIMPIYGYNTYLIEDEEFIQELDKRGGTLNVYPCQVIPGRVAYLSEKNQEIEKDQLLKNLSNYMNNKSHNK